jgi:alkanesulfonate monooxygenase
LLSSATFRLPAQLAVIAAQVDAMSGGRVELGLGAGWYEEEHSAFGIPFPPSTADRLDRLAEQLEIIRGLWATDEVGGFSYSGRYYEILNNPGLPKPVQRPHPPIIVGGEGTKKTPEIAARFADECNVPFAPVELCNRVFAALDAACERIDRDPSSITRSAAVIVCAGADDAEISRRAAAIGRDVNELRLNGATGTPDEVANKLLSYGQTGATRMYLQILDLNDLDHLRFIAEHVMPLVEAL